MTAQADFVVPDMHCAGCMAKIEAGLGALAGVSHARANLSTRRVHVAFDPAAWDEGRLLARLEGLGFKAARFRPMRANADDEEARRLLKAMAVAGFAAANIMLLSVSVWAGLASDMDEGTRQLFHWLSALIALPAIVYAGRPFFASAYRALRARAMTMDVPIALAVVLATAASLMETVRGGDHVYFDASVGLLFFLLIGRFLDRRARSQAFAVAGNLLALRAAEACVMDADGRLRTIAADAVAPGMRLLVGAGMTVPADGEVVAGASDIDTALITGETLPRPVGVGDRVHAGTTNLSGPLTILAHRAGEATLLADIVRLMEAAEQSGGGYVRLADRLARIYAPAIHVLAAATFIAWLAAGAAWHDALMTTVAVLIITCPCALGLAVPVVQVVAAGKLLARGVLLRSGDALERLAAVDQVVFDKTGTLSLGAPRLIDDPAVPQEARALAAALARGSSHPLAKALVAGAGAQPLPAVGNVIEHPGAGIAGEIDGIAVRLGRRGWAAPAGDDPADTYSGPHLWLARAGAAPLCFRFQDTLRPDAAAAVAATKALGLGVSLLSGDREHVADQVARSVGIADWHADCRPDDKLDYLRRLGEAGHRVLMVGDGLNDAPALKRAFVSMAPASGADITQSAADLVFQGERLAPVPESIALARRALAVMKVNFTLAIAYNALAVPLAVAGLVTPLIAAVAMSSSSLLVTLNALRLKRGALS
ncbi:MAG: heavy metal translocating P-type ATPase [Pseudomonadota bacterium]